jgi:hypothetical protein
LMATGEISDAIGHRHKVSYTTGEQNDQMIGVVSPAPLRLVSEKVTFTAAPNSQIDIPIAIKRDSTVEKPIRLELIVPPHMRDVSAAGTEVSASTEKTLFTVRFGASPGPCNMPLTLRGTSDILGDPVVAELSLECVPSPD